MTLRKTLERSSRRQAFTLMEMLIVVAIIVALAGIGTVYLLPQWNKAKEREAQTGAYNLEKALMAYYTDHEQNYPPANNLQALCVKDQFGGPYISGDALNDPWGKPYAVEYAGAVHQGAKPDVYTMTPGGEKVGNWKR